MDGDAAINDVPNNLGGMLDLGANDATQVTNSLKLSKVCSRVWNLPERLQTADSRVFDAILAGNTIFDERPRTLLLDTLDVLQINGGAKTPIKWTTWQ